MPLRFVLPSQIELLITSDLQLRPYVYRTTTLEHHEEVAAMGGRKSLRGPGYRRLLSPYQRAAAIENAEKLSPLPEPTNP